jgi:hypothetical protein
MSVRGFVGRHPTAVVLIGAGDISAYRRLLRPHVAAPRIVTSVPAGSAEELLPVLTTASAQAPRASCETGHRRNAAVTPKASSQHHPRPVLAARRPPHRAVAIRLVRWDMTAYPPYSYYRGFS